MPLRRAVQRVCIREKERERECVCVCAYVCVTEREEVGLDQPLRRAGQGRLGHDRVGQTEAG